MKSKEFITLCKNNDILDVQLTINKTYETTLRTVNDEIKKKETVDITTYIIKATYNDNTVNISSEYLNEDLIDTIKEVALYTENKNKDELIKKISIKTNNDFNKEVIDDLEDKLLEVNKIREKEYKNNKSITQEVIYGVISKEIINSNGLDIASSNSKYTYWIESASNNGGESVTDCEVIVSKTKDKLDIVNTGKKVLEINNLHLNEQDINTDKYNIILYPRVVAGLIDYVVSLLDSSKTNKNMSYLKDKLNKKVFSDKLTIIEDPTDNLSTSYRPFDDEGVVTTKKELIKDGVIKTFLYDNKNAKEANTISTANSYANGIGWRNVYMTSSNSSIDELIKKMDNGIIVNDVMISSSSLNPTTGVYTAQIASGYLVENGVIKHAVKNAIFSSDLNELLNNIVDISNEIVYSDAIIGTPSLLIENINVTGAKK